MMDAIQADFAQNVKRIGLAAVITRADGTKEDLGTVAEYHNNPEAQAEATANEIGTITLCE